MTALALFAHLATALGRRAIGRRGALIGLLLLLTALLAGCGPGVGGTGTGDAVPPLATFNAQPAALCTSPLATALPCTPATAGAPAAVNAPLVLADGYPAAQVQATIADPQVQLQLRCPAWQFDGTWGESTTLGQRWYGVLQQGSTSQLATLAATAIGSQLVLTLHDQAGRPIAGPLPVAPVPGVTLAAPCNP
jgi:hypothetical protein